MKFTKHYASIDNNGTYNSKDMPDDAINSDRMYAISIRSGLAYGYQHVQGFYGMTYFEGRLIAACLAKHTEKGWLFEIYT